MNPNRFDRISSLFGERRLSRRAAVTKGAALAAGGAAIAGHAAAQDATPVAEATAITLPDTGDKTMFLFVQSFQSGNIAPAAGDYGTHTVTLEQGLGQTIYFADRPSREVGANPTPAFLDGLGFEADNPPNAAILMDAGDGTTDIAVVELFNPTYDEATHTATYDIAVLANWQNDLELGFQDAPSDLSNLPAEFGTAHLFIDDCSDRQIKCFNLRGSNVGKAGTFTGQSSCWSSYWAKCMPCTPNSARSYDDFNTFWGNMCNSAFPAACDHNLCEAEWDY